MKITALQPVEFTVDAIRMLLPVRYEEEDMPNDYPFRSNDTWKIAVDIETGQIRDWPIGVAPLDLNMKVTDSGVYTLVAADGSRIGRLIDDYVPDCIPNSYGDYLDFKIDANGKITNWSSVCDPQTVSECFFPDD